MLTFQGARVSIAPSADIPRTLRKGGVYDNLIQRVLNSMDPWETGDQPVHTLKINGHPIAPMAVPVTDRGEVEWGIHRGHHARRPGLSPFTEIGITPSLKGFVTVELSGSIHQPTIVRAYGGSYVPPLPWMSSAHYAIGGHEACLDYWQTHAYLHRGTLILPGTSTKTPPPWFKG